MCFSINKKNIPRRTVSLKNDFVSHLELFEKYHTIEECIICCGKVLEKLKRKHKIACQHYNNVLVCFENLYKSGHTSTKFLSRGTYLDKYN